MKSIVAALVLGLLAFACEIGPPPDSFQIRFANLFGIDGCRFAIGTDTGTIVLSTGPLAPNEVTEYSYVASGTYHFFMDNGFGWTAVFPQLPEGGMDDHYAFETGKKYEYGTNGGAFIFCDEK